MSHETEHQSMRRELDRAASTLDNATVARLRAARQHAVATPARASWPLNWLPLSAVAVAAFVAVAVVTLWWRAPEPVAVAAEELEWSVAKDGPDFFTDLEFYDWLRNENDAG